MSFSRRQLLGAIGCAGLGGVGVGSLLVRNNNMGWSERTVPDNKLSSEVRAIKPLARDFTTTIQKHYEADVYITRAAELIMEYQSNEQSADGLMSEFGQIARLFAKTVKSGEYQPVSLTIVVGKVQAIVPQPAVAAYIDDRLNEKAFMQTIEVTGIERRGGS